MERPVCEKRAGTPQLYTNSKKGAESKRQDGREMGWRKPRWWRGAAGAGARLAPCLLWLPKAAVFASPQTIRIGARNARDRWGHSSPWSLSCSWFAPREPSCRLPGKLQLGGGRTNRPFSSCSSNRPPCALPAAHPPPRRPPAHRTNYPARWVTYNSWKATVEADPCLRLTEMKGEHHRKRGVRGAWRGLVGTQRRLPAGAPPSSTSTCMAYHTQARAGSA